MFVYFSEMTSVRLKSRGSIPLQWLFHTGTSDWYSEYGCRLAVFQARADLARLAIIRKQREEQARKKAEEKRLADEKAAAAAKK